MNRIALAFLVAASLTLAACGPQLRALTTTIENPIGPVDIWRVKNTYGATLVLAVEYREYCWSKPFAELMADPIAAPLCRSRRKVVRTFQNARYKASGAIIAADRFVRDNPTINAASAIGAAWKAVSDFKSAVPAVR